jgi:hypothetical protein
MKSSKSTYKAVELVFQVVATSLLPAQILSLVILEAIIILPNPKMCGKM